MHIFTCPNCKQSLSSAQDVAGMAFTCPACGQLSVGPGVTGYTATPQASQITNNIPDASRIPTVILPASENPGPAAIDQAMDNYTATQPAPPQYQPQSYQPPAQQYQQTQNQPPSPSFSLSSGGSMWRTALTVLTCVLLAAVLFERLAMRFTDNTVNPPSPNVVPTPDVPSPPKNAAYAIVSGDTAAAYYLARVFTRAASIIEKDGKATTVRLTKAEQVAEYFVANLGAFAVGSKFEGKFVGLPEYIADNFKQAGYPATEGDLTADARASAVKALTSMSEAFLKVADKVR